ncbi:hypothetical protein [Citrobacter sp. MNAZ 1397]|uniref:hypothetical protein n=1 Tax=Citrobacter sp. MNAZ 1397 TaxID=2911205 RepID=UPI002026EFF3|nr:hypothetical protein [Citrobacter sp. MNAZ 1397]MCL9671527.1 hypothetical protein [Citrobacter sp. MNAZ 1397]
MKDEDWIIGRTAFDILESGSEQRVTKALLIESLTRKYLYIYENSTSIEEILLYESALKIIKNPPE